MSFNAFKHAIVDGIATRFGSRQLHEVVAWEMRGRRER
jgi:hypothetical protein